MPRLRSWRNICWAKALAQIRSVPVPERNRPCKRDELLHEVVGGVRTQADKTPLEAVADSAGASRLPKIDELPRTEVAEDACIGKRRSAIVLLADNHLFQRVERALLHALVF